MPKHFNKDTVAYKFKHDILNQDEYSGANDDQKKILWKIFLLSLKDIKHITGHQANTWTYPTKQLK